MFSIFNKAPSEFKEERSCSPIAVAVNVGDNKLIDTLLNYMVNVNMEQGLDVRRKVAGKASAKVNTKKTTPLQFACSLGLYSVVGRLLREGANPNLINILDKPSKENKHNNKNNKLAI
jgi:hypothetical protein